MTDPTDPTRYAPEYPDEAGYPSGVGILSQDTTVLTDEVVDDTRNHAVEFHLVNNENADIYEAINGETVIAGLPYNVAGDNRLVLLATSVLPGFRKQGVATELIRLALDDVRSQGKTVSVMCPIVHTFIERNPGYADLIDPLQPGVAKRSHRS